MRRRKEGKVSPPLTLRHVPPEAYLLAYEQALLRFPGVRGWGREESPRRACSQDTYLRAIHLQVYYCSQMFSFRREPAQRTRKVSTTSSPRLSPYISDDDGDGNENGQKVIGLDQQNNNFARASRFFVHFFAYDMKLHSFKFCGGREDKTTIFLFFPLNFNTVLQNNSRKFHQYLPN